MLYYFTVVYGCVTINNGIWIAWLDLFTLFTITCNHNKWLPKTRSILTALRLSSLLVFSSLADFLLTTESDWTDSYTQSQLCYDRRSVGQSVLVSSTHIGLTTRFLLLSDICRCVDVGRSLWRENGSVVYNYCWSSPLQPFFVPSTAGLIITFYCLRFETPPTWRARSQYLYPPGTGWPSYTPRHWVPFPSPCTTRRSMVEVKSS
jgi:hypothetical protein